MAFEQIKRVDKRPIIIAIVGVLLLAVVGFFFIPSLFTDQQPRITPEFALTEAVKTAYAEAAAAVARGDYRDALNRLDAEITAGQSGEMSADALYAEAKLKIYKADIYISHLKEYKMGFDLLYEVYADLRYDDTVGGEALMLAMAHTVQGIDEGALSIEQIQNYVLSSETFGNVVGTAAFEPSLYDELTEIDVYLVTGFWRAMELTSAEKVHRLSQSYLLRLGAPYMLLASDEEYGLFISDLHQFESDINILADGFVALEQPYEEFIGLSYYNILRAYEALPAFKEDIVEDMVRTHEELGEYLAVYAADGVEPEYAVNAASRIMCRAVDVADFDTTNLNTEALRPYLDLVYESDMSTFPCPTAFWFISEEIDSRFAAYF